VLDESTARKLFIGYAVDVRFSGAHEGHRQRVVATKLNPLETARLHWVHAVQWENVVVRAQTVVSSFGFEQLQQCEAALHKRPSVGDNKLALAYTVGVERRFAPK